MTRMRRVPAAIAVMLVGAVLMAGCTSDSASNASPEPWNEPDAVWIQPAGTPMAADLVVPDGAELIGPVFTNVKKSGAGEWKVGQQSAFLLGSDGVDRIAQNLADQVAAPKLVPMFGATLCVQEVVTEDRTSIEPYRGDVQNSAVSVSCGGYQRSAPELEVDLRQDVTAPSLPIQGHLRWFSPDASWPLSLPDAPEGVEGPDTVPSGVDGYPDLKIAEGSFLAGPPGWGSGTGRFTAVIGVTGDPDDVFDAYVDPDIAKPLTVDAVVGKMHVQSAEWGGAGGVTYRVTLNEIGGSAWILVEAYND